MDLQKIGIDRLTTVDKVVAALRQAMFEGNINPGEQLREITLSQIFSVSRSTIREALRILTSNGLTVYSPNQGVTVRQLTIAEIDDIFLARSVLETRAVQAAKDCSAISLDTLQTAMRNYAETIKTNNPLNAADAHVEFHSEMVGLIGSERLMRTERSLMRDLQLTIASIDKKRDDLAKEIAKHDRLTQLLINQELEEAIEFVNTDLVVAKRFVIMQISEK